MNRLLAENNQNRLRHFRSIRYKLEVIDYYNSSLPPSIRETARHFNIDRKWLACK